MSIYTGGGYKSGSSVKPLRKWKHSMGLKTSAAMNSGIKNLWYSGYKPDIIFDPLIYGVKKPSKKPRIVNPDIKPKKGPKLDIAYKVDRTLKQTPQPRIANIEYTTKLYKDKTKEEKEQDKQDKLDRTRRQMAAKGALNPDKRTKAYRDNK